MLNFVTIRNFRSCDQIEIRLNEPLIALVGKNGAGKTNILHAIQSAAGSCAGELDSALPLVPHDSSRSIELELGFSIESHDYVYRTSCAVYPSAQILAESLTKGQDLLFHRLGETVEITDAGSLGKLRIGKNIATLPTLLQIFPEDSPTVAELRPVAAYMRAVQYHSLLQNFQEHSSALSANDSPFIEAAKYQTWKASTQQGTSYRSVSMRLVDLWLTDPERLAELKVLLGEDGLGVIADIIIHDFPVNPKPDGSHEKLYVISCVPGQALAGSGRPFLLNGLSAGTWRVLQLLTYLIYDKCSCVLLEQPEDSIHPGLLAKVIDILQTYSDRTQMICTTHSPRVMNLVGPSGIRLVTATGGRTVCSELSENELSDVKEYLEDEGTLAEFLEIL